MDTLIEMAIEMGEVLQSDERYIRIQMAQAAADEDETLQAMIGEFNLKRMALNTEYAKDAKDDAKIARMESEIKNDYDRIMQNENMQVFQAAKQDMDNLMGRISRILTLSAQGEDPHKADVAQSSCSGNCSSCGGCH